MIPLLKNWKRIKTIENCLLSEDYLI